MEGNFYLKLKLSVSHLATEADRNYITTTKSYRADWESYSLEHSIFQLKEKKKKIGSFKRRIWEDINVALVHDIA